MTESQKAFEAWWVSCHQTPCENRFGAVRDGRNAWQAAEAYGRKQALEDAVACCIRKPYKSEGCLLPPPMMADEARIRIKELIK